MAKSLLIGQTLSIEKTASGLYHFGNGDFGYDFDLSGKAFPMPDGGTTSWRAVNATIWEATNRLGKMAITYHIVLNGNSQSVVAKITTPDGATVENRSTWVRVSGGPGFLGKWRSTEMQGPQPTMKLTVEGTTIVATYSETQTVCNAKFDGKDYPVTTSGASTKQTWSFERTGPLSFKMTTKLDGKAVGVDVMTLASDGKTLTDDANGVAVNEPVKAVYERQ